MALGRNRVAEYVFCSIAIATPVGFLIYGLFGLSRFVVAYRNPQARQGINKAAVDVAKGLIGHCARIVGLIFLVLVLGAALVGITYVWQSHVANRTATVRAVFLHPANANLGPQIYMNDGTVWDINDVPENVRMIRGDKVRYVFVPNPLETMDSSSPDTCELHDVTTGYDAQAVRLSAPFKHSSCPAKQ